MLASAQPVQVAKGWTADTGSSTEESPPGNDLGYYPMSNDQFVKLRSLEKQQNLVLCLFLSLWQTFIVKVLLWLRWSSSLCDCVCLLQFFHFSSRAFPPSQGQFSGRVSWQGAPARGDASISLANSTLQDNGTYTCSVRNPPDVHGSPTSHTVLTVSPKGQDCVWPPLERVSGFDLWIFCTVIFNAQPPLCPFHTALIPKYGNFTQNTSQIMLICNEIRFRFLRDKQVCTCLSSIWFEKFLPVDAPFSCDWNRKLMLAELSRFKSTQTKQCYIIDTAVT